MTAILYALTLGIGNQSRKTALVGRFNESAMPSRHAAKHEIKGIGRRVIVLMIFLRC